MNPRVGRLLIAEPYLPDNNFTRAVILICEHNEFGTIGFVLNKPLKVNLNDVMNESDTPGYPLREGGPVGMDSVFFLHTYGNYIKESKKVVGNIYWGGDYNEIKALLSSNAVTEEEARIFVGYSGWAPGQLEEELKSGSWFLSEVDEDLLLKSSDMELWNKAVHNLKSNDKIWANAPKNPFLN
jgi:putative transcriptional regulator